MLIFWRLVFGHLFADFTLQTDAVNRWKRSGFGGMLFHCAIHPVIYAALTYPFLSRPWIAWKGRGLDGWACILILFLVHFAEDEWRVFTIHRYKTPDNTLYFLWDQIIHYGAIFAVAPFLEFSNPTSLFPERWPLWGCLLVVLTHMTTVLVYYADKDLSSRPFPRAAEKYLGMAERLILALGLLLPGGLGPLFAAGWIIFLVMIRFKKWVDFSWLSLALGGPLGLACGWAMRILYYGSRW